MNRKPVYSHNDERRIVSKPNGLWQFEKRDGLGPFQNKMKTICSLWSGERKAGTREEAETLLHVYNISLIKAA